MSAEGPLQTRSPLKMPTASGSLAAMEDEGVSKSERKRQALRLQSLGRELTALKPQQLAALPLPEKLAQSILDYQRFTSHEARRRQLQYIGRLMRDFDTTELDLALADLRGASSDARYRLHVAEQWRDRLLADPAAVTGYFAEFPEADRQAVRRAVTRTQQATSDAARKTAARALFRLIREQVPDAADDDAVEHQDA
jgi:ribosome-associated protein